MILHIHLFHSHQNPKLLNHFKASFALEFSHKHPWKCLRSAICRWLAMQSSHRSAVKVPSESELHLNRKSTSHLFGWLQASYATRQQLSKSADVHTKSAWDSLLRTICRNGLKHALEKSKTKEQTRQVASLGSKKRAKKRAELKAQPMERVNAS